MYLAHVRQEQDGSSHEHDLEQHLREVGRLAASFASSFGAADWARLAGLWHDLGKYRPGFQAYIRDQSGFERENAHIEGTASRVEHSAAGALHVINTLGELQGRLLVNIR